MTRDHFACAQHTVSLYEVTVGLGYNPITEDWSDVMVLLPTFWRVLAEAVSGPSHERMVERIRQRAVAWVEAERPGTSWYLEIEREGVWLQVDETAARALPQADGVPA